MNVPTKQYHLTECKTVTFDKLNTSSSSPEEEKQNVLTPNFYWLGLPHPLITDLHHKTVQ